MRRVYELQGHASSFLRRPERRHRNPGAQKKPPPKRGLIGNNSRFRVVVSVQDSLFMLPDPPVAGI
jgi:hypothetical protein